MNAMAQTQESPQEAARRLAQAAVRGAFKSEGLHEYQTADGAPWCWRWRVRKANGEKVIRPMHWNGAAYVEGEPKAPAAGKPLYRLPGLLADTTAPVWIVEGEKCADVLHKLGMVATTSGSSGSANGADWTPLQGRHCVVWPDNDAPGTKYLHDVAAKLGCTVEVVNVAPLNLPEKGDVADWLVAHPGAGAADILALERVAPPATSQPQGCPPEPLRRPLAPAAEYPMDALGPVLGSAARRIHEVVQAPAGLCGQAILAAASLAVQAHADVSLSGTVEPLSLWHVSIAESGERKSAADRWALKAHDEYEKACVAEWRTESEAYEIQRRAYEAAARNAEKGKDPEAVRHALQALGDAPEVPLLPNLTASEPTMEGLHKLYQGGRPSI
ncbi:MAG: DUF3987 domain-containing protein, partial [Rhodanobacteraceae bacterium]